MKRYKLIIVENDEDEQHFMKEGFDKADIFDIITMAKNGDELFEWFDEHPGVFPDVILSDLNMPGKNGYDIINEIKESPTYSHIPVIITSTSSTQTIIDKCLNYGAADYVVKPETFVDYSPYAQRLLNLIEKKQLVKE